VRIANPGNGFGHSYYYVLRVELLTELQNQVFNRISTQFSSALLLYKEVRLIGQLGTVQALAEFILTELRSAGYCPIYEEQLVRLWPIGASDREAMIRSFAEQQGFRLRFYCEGQCAVFEKQRSAHLRSSRSTVNGPL